ncbi:MAG: hypothetical protein RhofKO_29540 [Rhodothermales bacterium]
MKHNEQDNMYTRSNTPGQSRSTYELEGWVEEPFPTSNLKGFSTPKRTHERKLPVWASLAVWCGEE